MLKFYQFDYCICVVCFGWLLVVAMVAGAPSEDFLSQEISAADHPILKQSVHGVQAYRKGIKGRRNGREHIYSHLK